MPRSVAAVGLSLDTITGKSRAPDLRMWGLQVSAAWTEKIGVGERKWLILGLALQGPEQTNKKRPTPIEVRSFVMAF